MKLIVLAAVLGVAATPAVAQTSAQKASSPTNNEASKLPGFQPSAPLFSTPPAPGQQVIFQPSTQTPTQAFPPPAPLESYPICKPGQFDKCRQRGG